MSWQRLGYVVLWLAGSSLGCDRGAKPAPAATLATAAPAPSPAPSVAASSEWKLVLPPIVLPEWAKQPLEPDSDPRVLADTQGVCGQMTRQNFGSFKQMATLTRRWGKLKWLFAQGEPGAACDIERLVRDAARYPESDCPRLVDYFARTCKSYTPREIR